ncbi:hypothetical protein C8U37_10871 [Trichococcus patagoniensis]|uniref:DGQHR domain-containing protein n=1 Tax=Trichococcus patagoniensis TaxID=382641 RepID=A0A2T5IL02_9LACT|nr:hypothetical protein [Trichococcus patagoniensis]PTQ84504.1 hypothetical protein C8U37_10871 [Trichococcus patagoniensis]
MKILDGKIDERSNCVSLLASMTLEEYKTLVFESFNADGNIEGQRGVIKRSSVASKIRKRMNDDFINGALFPQVVIGLLYEENDFKQLKQFSEEHELFKESLSDIQSANISIIDGMQRSGVYFTNFEGNESREIRVEFWLTNQSTKLLYRMLVLNTGQVPWNTRRQVEVIFGNLSKNMISELNKKFPDLSGKIEILGVDDGKRRSQAGKYHKSSIIEMYLGFNTRKVKVNVSDELADEFQRFDMMESIEKDVNFNLFVECLGFLCTLDLAFAKYNNEDIIEMQFRSGKDVFTSAPACLGFIVACSEFIMGKVPVNRTDEEKTARLQSLREKVNIILQKMNQIDDIAFLGLSSLSDVVEELPKTKIGDEMRRLFKNAFTEILRYDDLDEIPSLETFWRE